jgi:heme exporter protein C
MGVATIWSFEVPDIAAFQAPGFARIFLWHFPCPMLFTFLIVAGAWFSFRMFVNPKGFVPETDAQLKAQLDVKSVACLELGYLFALLTMATGIMFSQIQWGAWWSWDTRQTSFLMVLLIYAGYFTVRFSFDDPSKRAANSSVYGLAALLPTLFLVFIFPRLPQIVQMSLHPSDSILAGKIKGDYAYCVIMILVLFTIMTVYLFNIRVRAGLAELELENKNARLVEGGNPAPTGVVRPVSLSE